jgi:hypothetical protein
MLHSKNIRVAVNGRTLLNSRPMDETVIKAMQKWPNVPNVYGWLRLDRRGNWLLQTAPGRFERIGNRGLIEFIARNYESAANGSWFFQNGPQRVFVGLDYTPHVMRLGDDGRTWITQAGTAAGRILELLLDENDQLVLVAETGPGIVDDRDIPVLLERLAEGGAALDPEALMGRLRASRDSIQVQLMGHTIAASAVDSRTLPARFHFVSEPVPQQENA